MHNAFWRQVCDRQSKFILLLTQNSQVGFHWFCIHKQGWQSSVCNSTSAEQTTEIFRCHLVSSFDFKYEKVFRPSVRPSSSWTTVRSILTLNKYELNRLDSYCKFKKYEKFRPMSSVFVLSIYNTMCVTGYIWKHPADDTIPVTESWDAWKCFVGVMIPVTESRDMHEGALQMTQFLWQSHGMCMKAPCRWQDSCDRIMRIRTDYDRYLDTPNDIWAQALPWWRAHHHAFHDLSFMVRDNLAVPASGCAVERQFSISGRIVSWERSRLKGETIADSMLFKAGLTRKGLALREMDITVDEDHDWNLAIPPLAGEVPKEWADGWWLEKMEKIKCPVRPFISNLMCGFDDDDDEDIYV